MREKRGITLIALVVTIVVLLILAGISINMLKGENGLIKKASDSKLETRAGNIEEEVQLWKNNNKMIKKQNEVTGTNQKLVSKEDMLKKLTDEKIAYENEINRKNETITVKRNDGTIVRVINYSDVKIHISKTPETEKAGVVVLSVDSVEGIPKSYTEEEVQNYISTMSEEAKKERLKELILASEKLYRPETNIESFEDLLKEESISEDEFWKNVEENEGINDYLKEELNYLYGAGNELNRRIIGFITTNPEGETSSIYYATENGKYKFTVEDILTGNRYTEEVEVTNIDKTMSSFVVDSFLYEGWRSIVLYDANEKKYTTFEKAYIVINDEKIDISSEINYINIENLSWKNQYMIENYDDIISYSIEEHISDKKNYKFWGTKQKIILVKDDIEYTGIIMMNLGEES